MDGLNESTRAGDGSAYIWNFEPVHRTINQLIQRDLYHQKAARDLADKSALELQKTEVKAKPEDIPDLTNYFNTFKSASIQAAQSRNPQERAKWSRVADDAFISHQALANKSQEQDKLHNMLPIDYHKAAGNGFPSFDEFNQKLEKAKHQSTRQNEAEGLDSYMAFTGTNQVVDPGKYEEHYTGGIDKQKVSEPIIQNGVTVGWNNKEVSKPKNPLPVMLRRAVEQINSSPNGTHKLINDTFNTAIQSNPDEVAHTIAAAQEHVKTLPKDQQEHILPYLQPNALGFEMANIVLHSKPQETQLAPSSDPLFEHQMQRQQHAQDKALQTKFHYEDLNLRNQERTDRNRKWNIIHGSQSDNNLNTQLMYDAAKNPDKEFTLKDGKKIKGADLVDNFSQSIAADNPDGQEAVTISKANILNPERRKALEAKLGISIPNKYAGKLTMQQVQDKVIDDFVNQVNDKYSLNLTKEHVEKNAIPVYLQTKNLPTETFDNGKSVKSFTTTKVATAVNPAISTYGQFHAGVSQQSASKKLAKAKLEGQALDEMNGEDVAPAPPKKNVLQKAAGAISKWAKYKR